MATSQYRDLRINLSADAAQLEKGLSRAEKAMEKYQRSVEDASNAVARLEQELQADIDRTLAEVEGRAQARMETWASFGQGMVVAGGAMALGLGLAGRAAIQWESAWTGVEKVLDGSPEQIALLEEQFRDLATAIPASHEEIAEVAAAAAQLGVASEYLVGFSNSALALGASTNLASQDAAMGLARLSTVMGVSFGDVDQMGSSLVELGNNFAAMEDEILAMSLRLAGMGNQIGLTSGEVMGLAAGFSAVGIEAELGGGAFSRAMTRVQTSVQKGGQRLEEFGQVAGMSADEFATAFEERPNEAIVAFLKGLDEVNESGGSVSGTLKQLGLNGTEIADVMGRASAAWETVGEAMEVGNTGFEEGNALLEEAAARYATTESQVQMAKNSMNDMAIDIGNKLLPMIGGATENFSSWLTLLESSPDSVQGAVTAVGGVGAAASIAAGAFLMGVPKVAEFRDAMEQMGPRTQAVGRGLSATASFLTGPWGAAIGVGVLALGMWADKKAEAAQRTAEFVGALRMDSGEIGTNTNQLLANIIAKDDLITKAEMFGVSTDTLVAAMLGEEDALRKVEKALEDESTTYVRAADGGTTASNKRSKAARELQEAIFGTNEQLDEARNQHEAEAEVMEVTEEGTKRLSGATEGLAGMQELLGIQTGGATQQIRDLAAELDALTQSNVSATEAEIGFLDAVERASESVATNGATLDINTDAGRRNMDGLLGLRDRSNDYTSSVWETTRSVDETIAAHERGRAEFIAAAREMGATAEEAEDLADEYLGIPEDVATEIQVTAEGSWTLEEARGAAGVGAFRRGLATGGPVRGPGGPTEDKIPAMLSAGEHVWTAAEVQAAGGQEAVSAMRDLVKTGALKFAAGGADEPPARRYAKGGPVLPESARVVDDHREDVRINMQKLIEAGVTNVADAMAQDWKEYAQSGGAVVSAWRSQIGVPYSWGGGGPSGPGYGFAQGAGIRGFDCSSLMQYGWAKAGVSLPRVTYSQISYGQPVSKGSERPGDLVFPHRGHVAGVSGPGRIIHAPYTGSYVHERAMYPSPIAIRRPGRYDTGGIARHGQLIENMSHRPERVLSPRQTDSFERLVDALTGTTVSAHQAGPREVHYHAHHVPGYSTEADLQRVHERRERRERIGRPE